MTNDIETTTVTTDGTPTIEQQRTVAAGAGDHLHFLNHLATIKVGAGTSASGMNAVEFTAPRGFGPPLHVHREEDELLYVIEGEVRVGVGDDSDVLTAGGVASLPHGVPHVFQVLSPSARLLTVAAGRATTPSFDRFVAAVGDPTDPDCLPAPIDVDPGRLGTISAAHGIEILGPPPPPLD